jgi:hypothetical protein
LAAQTCHQPTKKRIAVEAKSGQTIADDFFAGLRFWRELAGRKGLETALVYGGDRRFVQDGCVVHPW